jgi:hypothetical protein
VRFEQLEISLAVPSIQIRAIQDVLRPDETFSFKNTPSSTEQASAFLCTIRLSIDDISVSASQITDCFGSPSPPGYPTPAIPLERKLSASSQHIRLEVLQPSLAALHIIAGPNATRHLLPPALGRHRLSALELQIAPCKIDFDFSAEMLMTGLKGGDTQLDFVDEAAELIIGSLWSWRSLSELSKSKENKKLEARRLVWSISQASERAKITSFPAFLNRVSYLVGSTSNLRSDDGWKILHHLRHCLRMAELEVIDTMDRKEWPETEELLADVRESLSQWKSWEIDSDDFRNSDFLPFVYESKLKVVERTLPRSPLDYTSGVPIQLEWRAGLFEARLCDGERVENKLSIGPLEVFATSSGMSDYSSKPLCVSARITLDLIEATVDRGLLGLIRHIIRVRRTFEHKIRLFQAAAAPILNSSLPIPTAPRTHIFDHLPWLQVDGSFGIRRVRANGRADSLQAKGSLDDASISFSSFLGPSSDDIRSSTTTAGFLIGSTSLAAWERNPNREELLLSSELDNLSLSTSVADLCESNIKTTIRLIVASTAVRGSIPKDAIRVYEFIENWGSENLSTYDSLLTELREGLDEDDVVGGANTHKMAAMETSSPTLIDILGDTALAVELIIPEVILDLQAMRALRMTYSIRDISAHARIEDGLIGSRVVGPVESGISIGSQTVQFFAKLDDDKNRMLADSYTTFDLPVIRLQARFDSLPCRQITLSSTIDSISLSLDATTIDHILNVQDRFGQDIDELLNAIRAKRAKFNTAPHSSSLAVASTDSVVWEARMALRGFKVGVQGPQATQWIEAELLEGVAQSSDRSGIAWSGSASNLTLSLAQRHNTSSRESGAAMDRRNRLAFFRLDFTASNENLALDLVNLPPLPALSDADTTTTHLHLRFPRVHAVLQPSAIEALGDLVDHFEREIDLQRTLRKREIDAIKQRVIQTLEMGDKSSGPRAASWLSTCIVSFKAKDVGIAIPLGDGGIPTTESKIRRGKTDQSTPAFLTTLSSITFATQKGAACYARTDRLAFQFVSDLDPSRKGDFNGAAHQSKNQIVFPEMQCTLTLPKDGPVVLNAVVSGIEIDLESSVVAYTYSLIDIYRLSHERFAKFALQPITLDSIDIPTPLETLSLPSTLMGGIESTFEFKSGTIRIHSQSSVWDRDGASSKGTGAKSASHLRGKSLNDFTHFSRSSISKLSDLREDQHQPDLFLVPGISITAEYQDGNVKGISDDQSELHIDAVVHASTNTLYPTLLPFISSVAHQLSRRNEKYHSTTTPGSSAISRVEPQLISESLVGTKLKLGISLKIDQSRLDISCLPAAEVTATLTWENGGFLLTTTPEVRGVEFAARVDGVAIGLKHSYSPEDCLSAEAKGMVLSISFFPGSTSTSPGTLSVIVDLPDLSAEMNFRHLQDWLCLKAVWIDRMDLGPVQPSSNLASPPAAAMPQPDINTTLSTTITTLVLVRLQQIQFSCDLGQAIGRSSLTADSVVTRLRWVPHESRSLSLVVKSVVMKATGRTAGSAALEGVMFETRLRDDRANLVGTASDLVSLMPLYEFRFESSY